jgi:SpoVK/Ycf46/Vps4 family AAA+-type ATPase
MLMGMARADLLIHLVRSAQDGDDVGLRRTVESLIAEERDKQHHLLAERLENALHQGGRPAPAVASDTPSAGFVLTTPRRRLDELVLPESVRTGIEELIEEQQRAEVLRSSGLEPRHRILLVGPPGNGKTTLAEAIAEALLVPLVIVRYEEVIGSFLGETAARLAAVFQVARTRRCVLFFDEFDTVEGARGRARNRRDQAGG